MLIDNIWVINLDRSKDRLKNISDNFSKYGVHFKRFSAIDGKTLSKDKIESYTTPACRSILCNYGVVGCAMSHIKMWEQLAKDVTTDYYVILEDDAFIDEKFPTIINDLEGIMKSKDIDILNLHCRINVKSLTGDLVSHKGYTFGRVFFPLQFTGYILSKPGAKKILKAIGKINYHIDFQLAFHNLRFNNINYYMCHPYIIREGGDFIHTTIGERSVSPMLWCMKWLGYHNIAWSCSLSAFAIDMKHTISLYIIILLLLMLLNNITIKSGIINFLILVELIIYMCV